MTTKAQGAAATYPKRFAHQSVAICRGRYGWEIVLYGISIDGTPIKRVANRLAREWRDRIAKTLESALEEQ